MQKTWLSRLRCWKYNLLPSYRGSGGWIMDIADDWRAVTVKLPLNLWTRNSVGTIYCGSVYSALAPFFMGMYYWNLGKDYLVWDKHARIEFKKPGKTTLYAHMTVDQADIDAVRAELETKRHTERTYRVELKDADGIVHAYFETTLYLRRKQPFVRKMETPVPVTEAAAD
jgi:hypothetical protein